MASVLIVYGKNEWLHPADAAKFIGVKDTFFRKNRNKPDAIPFRKDGHRTTGTNWSSTPKPVKGAACSNKKAGSPE